MQYIEVENAASHRNTSFWFAVEEYAARHWQGEYFVVWQVDPCVMVGRNQLIDNEVNVDWCRDNGVAVWRRKSGGGCIYSDEGCLLMSYINNGGDAADIFRRRMEDTVRTLEAAGVGATLSGRNDIMVQGRKVAGAAIYRCGERVIMHDSLLFNTDFDRMERAITPSRAKLHSKGVQSVSQRVGNVGDFTSLSLADYAALSRRVICGDAVRRLIPEEMAEVEKLEQQIGSERFIYGCNPRHSIVRRARLDGVGTIEASVELRNNTVQAIDFTGDFFVLGDIDTEICARLKGVDFGREAVHEALASVRLSEVIRGLDAEGLLSLLFGDSELPQRKPLWLKSQPPSGEDYLRTEGIIRRHNLNTICRSGRCPNRAECWKLGTATFMIGGDVCTRKCRFCNTKTGRPAPLDDGEPMRVAESIRLMNLRYAVITSVDRDDVEDLGASHWAETIRRVKELCPATKVEALIPDFQGRTQLIDAVLEAEPDVVGHNMETVRKLTPTVRSVARYEQSLDVLRHIESRGFESKTGFMLGLGESDEEVEQLLRDIRDTGCRRLTIGQYLRPTTAHLPVVRYYTPEEFADWRDRALRLGFTHAVSGPLVRSSYHADAAR